MGSRAVIWEEVKAAMGSLQVERAEGTAGKTGIFFMLCSLSVKALC